MKADESLQFVAGSNFLFFLKCFNVIFQHMIGYLWWLKLIVEEEPEEKTPERIIDPREALYKLSHIPTTCNKHVYLVAIKEILICPHIFVKILRLILFED